MADDNTDPVPPLPEGYKDCGDIVFDHKHDHERIVYLCTDDGCSVEVFRDSDGLYFAADAASPEAVVCALARAGVPTTEEALRDEVASKQGVIAAVDRVLRNLGWVHASRACAIENGTANLKAKLAEALDWIEDARGQMSRQSAALVEATLDLCPYCGMHSPVQHRNRVWVHPDENAVCDASKLHDLLNKSKKDDD